MQCFFLRGPVSSCIGLILFDSIGVLPEGVQCGPPATVGINAGDGMRHEDVTGSNTNDVINIEETTNIGVPGIWAFQVNGAEVLGK